MSVNDPLIKDLKVCTGKFLKEISIKSSITDCNDDLVVFCITLEAILNKGLNLTTNSFGFIKTQSSYQWLEKIAKSKDEEVPYQFTAALEHVHKEPTLLTPTGKLRLLIRQCLVRKCLYYPVEHIIKYGKNLLIYSRNSVIGDGILSEILLSVLYQCSKISFDLSLRNCSFLDDTWLLPEMISLELVPSKLLGLSVSYAGEKAIILYIKPGSVVAEHGKIAVGDVLVSLNQMYVCTNTKGRLGSIMNDNKGRPITLTIAKARSMKDNILYPPIVKLLQEVGLVVNQTGQHAKRSHITRNSKNGAFTVDFLGEIEVGLRGDSKQLDKAVQMLETAKKQKAKQSVLLEIGELGVKCFTSDTMQILFEHSFMNISACGSITNRPKYFGYLAGSEYCNIAQRFNCYIFSTGNYDLVCTILQSIGQGFQRTHYAV